MKEWRTKSLFLAHDTEQMNGVFTYVINKMCNGKRHTRSPAQLSESSPQVSVSINTVIQCHSHQIHFVRRRDVFPLHSVDTLLHMHSCSCFIHPTILWRVAGKLKHVKNINQEKLQAMMALLATRPRETSASNPDIAYHVQDSEAWCFTIWWW